MPFFSMESSFSSILSVTVQHFDPALVDTQVVVNKLIKAIASVDKLAFDTEFMRTTTYWPRMCLLQLAWESPDGLMLCAVDLTKSLDLGGLWDLFTEKNCLKIAHAPAQDLEGLDHQFGVRVRSLFDTQVAAMLTHPLYAPVANLWQKRLAKMWIKPISEAIGQCVLVAR